MNRQIWPGCGESRACARLCTSSRTTSMRWARPWSARPRSRTSQARSRDPITILEDRLRAAGALTDEQVKRVHADADRVVTDAVRFAEESPLPAPEELYKDVYGET